jgi:vanillate O-demethylase ferredoxin subunit
MTARLIMKMNVVDARADTDDITVFTLRHPWRIRLPPPEPGAHVDLRLPDGRTRQYSLCGDPNDDAQYRIAVKREDDGRGASRWIHANLKPGAIAHVSTPRNNFPLAADARRHVFVAGGIGITPVAAMARRVAQRGEDFRLHYCARSDKAPLIGDLRAICGPDRLATYFSGGSQPRRFDCAAALARPAPGVHLYCCGPQRLTDAVREATRAWPGAQVHFEVFKPTLDENFQPEPFDVRIASTGETIRVPAARSALDVLRERGFPLPSSCELGVCGSCVCRYRDGTVIHRDSVLGVGDRQDRMMLCVSRARVAVTLEI